MKFSVRLHLINFYYILANICVKEFSISKTESRSMHRQQKFVSSQITNILYLSGAFVHKEV